MHGGRVCLLPYEVQPWCIARAVPVPVQDCCFVCCSPAGLVNASPADLSEAGSV